MSLAVVSDACIITFKIFGERTSIGSGFTLLVGCGSVVVELVVCGRGEVAGWAAREDTSMTIGFSPESVVGEMNTYTHT